MKVAAIEALEKELDRLIAIGADAAEIYEMSIKIDRLIIRYYSDEAYTGMKN